MRSQCSCEIPASTFYIKSFVLFFSFIATSSVNAVEFEQGGLYGSWDTTLSYGQTYRVQSRASEIIGAANGGTGFSVNKDDGNLNYDKGLVSSTLKFTTELELNYKNYGAFFRGTGFRDFRADDSTDSIRTPLASETIELVGEDLKLLDAYVWGGFEVGKMPLDIRVGEQVVSWGESTFIQNSINVINPVDVSKLRLPGSELKEALLPVGIVSASLGLTENVSLEGFYEYDYERILIDPPGSFFSTNDFVGHGGAIAVAAGAGQPPFGDNPPIPGTFVTRAPDDRPSEGGQYGVAMRAYIEQLNDTEFGFYYINYHNRLPLINGVVSPGGAGILGAQYQIAYPEDIDLFGLSFNTQLGNSGWALQGEYSYRNDVPLQIDLVEVLAATINAGIPSQVPGAGFLAFAPGEVVQGFVRKDVSQFQATATRIFGPMLKADQALLLGEFAVTHVHDMPSKSVLLLSNPGTDLTGNPANQGALAHPFVEPGENFPDATSWGYRIVGRLEYNNVLSALTVQPRVSWQHDVSGITPGPGGNFLEDRKAVSLGVRTVYQNTWVADLSYTNFFGADRLNLIQDRDFIAFSMAYSF